MTAQDYELADILSITTGRMLSRRNMAGVQDILTLLTRDGIFTHQIPRAVTACAPHILSQHPQLESVCLPDDLEPDDIDAWLDEIEQRFGRTLPLTPLPDGAWEHRNPIEELAERIGPEKVIPVVVEP